MVCNIDWVVKKDKKSRKQKELMMGKIQKTFKQKTFKQTEGVKDLGEHRHEFAKNI